MSERDGGFFSDDDRVASSPAPPPPPPPSRRGSPLRAAFLVVVLLATVGAGVADRAIHRPAPATAAAVPVTSYAPASVESSVWYCAGGTSAVNSDAATTLLLVNTTTHPVTGTLNAVNDATPPVTKSEPIVVPPSAQSIEVPGTLVGGDDVASRVELDGGGVLVSESVAGPLGWSIAPCSRSTASAWYFASGATVDGGTLSVALFNPTTADAVVDMTFITPSGPVQPQPFEGIVLAPGQLGVEHVDRYVQDKTSVSTIVTVRTGAVVAAALQAESSGGIRGLSLRLGVPTVQAAWTVPRSIDFTGTGTATTITVFNPTGRTDRVRVRVSPFRSPVAVFDHTISPESAWVFTTTAQTRIPVAIPFLATVRVRSGPGVVVDRTVRAPSGFQTPQFGAVSALAVGPGQPPSDTAVLPGPGTQPHPTVPGARVLAISLVNPGPAAATASVSMLAGSPRPEHLVTVRVPAGGALTLSAVGGTGLFRLSGLARVGQQPLVVTSDRPLVTLEDLSPSATQGVVSVAAAARSGAG